MAILHTSEVTLIDSSGTDLTVVNAARISFRKRSPELSDQDRRLIRYLATHEHWTPFGHCHATFHIRTPIFVARQLMRSNVGIVYNEVSRRYVDSSPDYWHPADWRLRPAPGHNKQGSSPDPVPPEVSEAAHGAVAALINICDTTYHQLLSMGIAPEQARAFLPLCTYTELYMTASMAAYARVVRLRLDPHAQQEIREVASRISEHCATLWPVSWEALMSVTPRPDQSDPQPPIVSCPVP